MVMQDNQVNLDWNALFSSVFAFLLVVTLFKFSERMLESSDAISHSSYLPQTKRKSWINEIAEKEPFTIYPWLYEKFGGRKLIDASWEERYKTAQRICAQLGLVYNIPCKAQSYGMVEIPIDYFTSNRDYVIDALDEITGVKHKRPWHYQSLLPQVTVEGGEPIPVQYRHLTGWIDEPLPEYSLLTELLPAVEPEVKERKIDAVLKQLKDGVETIQESEKFRLFLTTMAKFHDYSIGNQILIMIQKKDAAHVAGFNTWKELGRWVKKGEKGIAILVPVMPPRPACPECGARIPKGARFCQECGVEVERVEIEVTPAYFKVVYVFDISQTEGKPLPQFEVPVLTGDVNEQLFTNVMELSKGQGLDVSFESRPYQDPSIKGQYFDKTIWVKPDEPRAQQLKTLLHEVAHYYSEGVFQIPRRDAETIAESAAFVIGAHYGFDTGLRSFPYVALWAQDKKVLEQNLSAIRRVAGSILEKLGE